jgi:hypothetical protein
VVREEYLIPTYLTPVGSRARGLPHLVPPPVEEVVIYQDSLNGLSIGNQGNWTHLDNSARPAAWHIDSLYACSGKAWWCGRVDSTWTFDSNRRGYENNWAQYLTNGAWLDSLPPSGNVTIGFRHRVNIEPNYDYAAIQVFDPIEAWRTLAVFTGKIPNNQNMCDTVTVTVPDSLIQAFYGSVNRDIHPKFPFRFVFTSDIAYSSQDGLYDGDGWSVDNVTVKKGTTIRFSDNMENGPGNWAMSVFPPVGDFFAISSNVFTEDLCTENRTNVWSDWDASVQSVVPRMDNLLRTPSIFINRPSTSFVLFDVYRNLPLSACFYYHLRFRTRNAGDPNWTEWVDPTRLVYYGASKDWARQKVDLPGASGKDSLQVEFALTDYSQIYCGGVGNSNGVYTFFDNLAVAVTATAGPPQFVQRDVDLFQDTFQTSPFFKDDNVNTALGDSAVVEVSTPRGYKTGFLKWRVNGGSWNSSTLLVSAPALPRVRYGDLPAGSYPANSFIEYYFAVTDSTDSLGTLPYGAKFGPDYFSVSVLPLKSAINPTLGCFDSLATILMVNNYYGREPKNLWADALRAQGYKFDVWDVNGPTSGIGNTPGGSDPANLYHWPAAGVTPLLQYSTILWHAGSLTAFTLSKQDQALIQSWIQQPGKNRNLWIAGDNVANELAAGGQEYNSFLSFTCGMRYLRDLWENFPQDTLHPLVSGMAGDDAASRAFHVNADCPIIDKFDYLAVYQPAGGSGKIGTVLKYPNTASAATRYATKWVSFGTDSARVLFQGFNYSSIEEGGERLQLAKNIVLDYFQVPACYTPSSVEVEPNPEAPTIRNALAQNSPNPFNPMTTIAYSIAQTGPVTIRIYNAGGALIRTLVDKPHAPGSYSIRWDGKDGAGLRLASGVYFYKIETASGFRDSKKLILLK